MALRSRRVLSTFVYGDLRHAHAEKRDAICVRLVPRPGVAASERPPVRIFMGTEAVQFRAERAFLWSIERVRDPARCYDIHLLRDLAGFERRLWLTGFTNYRFAIPELAGGRGRAIYNDADQIYLRDPAELFDMDMNGAGVRSINDRDTSVMLIDCEKMAPLWNLAAARRCGNRELERRMREAGLWGDLDDRWNARDAEYVPGASNVVHYTTIHTQPWRPTPQDYVYGANPAGEVWAQIECEADAAGFQVFDRERPGPDLAARAARLAPGPAPRARFADVNELLADARAQSLLYCGCDGPETAAAHMRCARIGARARRHVPLAALARGHIPPAADVVAVDGLAALPDLDIAWIIDALFAAAERALLVAVTMDSSRRRSTPADPIWWVQQVAAAAARHPGRHWRLIVRRPRRLRAAKTWRWCGGALLESRPRVWALAHYKTGHASQARGLAEALGWPFDTRTLAREPLRHALALARSACGWPPPTLPGGLRAPWPDVVVASGWLPSLLARAIAARSRARTRLILLGRRGGRVGESQHIGMVCRHFELPPNPRELVSVLPPNKVDEPRLADARQRWPDLFSGGSGARVVMLVGGDTAQHRFDAATAKRMTGEVAGAVRAAGARLAILTSRRTREDSLAAVRRTAGAEAILEPWNARAGDANPYLGYLAQADVLVVTGESESMLAEAIATGKPVYILPLPERAPGARRRLADWVVRQARTDRYNKRGSRRPQEGLQYLCARLIEWRWFVPRRNMPMLHDALIDKGVARRFAGEIAAWTPPAWHETDWIARRIRAWLPVAGRRPQNSNARTAMARAADG